MFCKIIQELLEAAVQEMRDADQQMSCIYNIQGLGTNSKVFITELLICFYQGQYQYQILIIKESDNQYLELLCICSATENLVFKI